MEQNFSILPVDSKEAHIVSRNEKNPRIFGKILPLSWSELAIGLCLSLLGLVLIICPGLASSVVFNVIGAACIIIGVVHLARYSMLDTKASIASNGMLVGLLWLIGGILLIALKGLLLSLLPILFGLILLVGGIIKLQYTLNFKRMGVKRWYFELAATVLSIAFGVIILVNPFSTALLLMRIIGIALLIEGVQDLISRCAYKKASDAYYIEFEEE